MKYILRAVLCAEHILFDRKSRRNNNIFFPPVATVMVSLLNEGDHLNETRSPAANATSSGNVTWLDQPSSFTVKLLIPLYSVIFLLAVVGNSLVIATLIQSRRMRTVTNIHLLNLAVSDLMLGIVCMPFTLVGSLLRNFIFGEIMCKVIPYLQAVSVSVSAWTLVTISVERYYAICQPLKSRHWQTLNHAYKMIAIIWFLSFSAMCPIAALSTLLPVGNTEKLKCRENWPAAEYEIGFTIVLDLGLLIVPLVVMIVMYTKISLRLQQGIQLEMENLREGHLSPLSREDKFLLNYGKCTRRHQQSSSSTSQFLPLAHRCVSLTEKDFQSILRVNSSGRSLAAKKRIIYMLFVMILEFFICWTPIYIVNTMSYFCPDAIYTTLGNVGISLLHLLSYVSCCCNPITYCFMHRLFRHAFLAAFSCKRRQWPIGRTSETSENETSFYISPQNSLRRDVLKYLN